MDDLMSVQVKKGHIRKEPSFLSPVLKSLSYADTVIVLAQQADWKKIKATQNNVSGWMHDSALTIKKIILNPGEKDVQKAVNSDEYALAGKGFNKEVEKKYQAKNPCLNFAWIDKMETFNVSHKKMNQFLKQGNVLPQGGWS